MLLLRRLAGTFRSQVESNRPLVRAAWKRVLREAGATGTPVQRPPVHQGANWRSGSPFPAPLGPATVDRIDCARRRDPS
jgi:hypothetical protein